MEKEGIRAGYWIFPGFGDKVKVLEVKYKEGKVMREKFETKTGMKMMVIREEGRASRKVKSQTKLSWGYGKPGGLFK